MATQAITAKDINALSGRDYPEAWRVSETVRRLITRLEARLAYWLRYRATVNELEFLTDRQLADVGIVRANIREHARIAARVAGE
jgi:uncharacterized protein YjiS (DUF1127 family)